MTIIYKDTLVNNAEENATVKDTLTYLEHRSITLP